MQPQKPKSCELQSQKPAIKCKKEHKEDQIFLLPHKPATKVKKQGQATNKDVLQNKNCSNVNIVNMQPQKPNFSDEQFKKPPQCRSISTKSNTKKLSVMTSNIKKLNNLCVRARNVHQSSVLISSQ